MVNADGAGATARRLDRRVIVKAAGALGAMAALGAWQPRAGSAAAQEAPETLAATWWEADRLQGYTLPGVEDNVVQADFPFHAVAPHWDGTVGTWPRIEMSFSPDGENWSEAIVVGATDHDAGRPDRDGRAYGRLVFTGRNSFVRYRTLDEAGNAAQVPGLAITYIDASAGPTIDAVGSAGPDPSTLRPMIISRSAWGANEAYRFEDGEELWPPDYAPIEHVIIHHTEGPNFEDPLVAIRSIYYYHAVTRGWGDIGYNYLVDFMGNVYEGRYGGENVVGGHAYQYARGSAGIGAMGRFGDEDATPEMKAGIVWITAWLARDLDPYGVSDFHETPAVPTICGHRDVNETTCPGDALYADLQEIRNYVSAVLYEGVTPGPEAGDFALGEAVEVVVEDANLRDAPGLDAWVTTTLPLGTVLTIADGPTTTDGYVWYQVAGTVGIGWCASFVLQRTDKRPEPMAGRYAPGDEVVVATDGLSLRDAPRLDGSVLAVMPTGTVATVVEGPVAADGYSWYALDGEYGAGWSVGEFLAPPGSQLPPPPGAAFAPGDLVAVATDALNLRTEPGLRAGVVAVLLTDTVGTVAGGPQWVDGYAWYQLETEAGTGWGVADFLTAAEPGAGTGREFALGDEVVVATDALNLRSGPSASADIQGTLPAGARLTVTAGPVAADGHLWYGVAGDTFGEGWASSAFLEAGGDWFLAGETVRVVDGELYLRSEPSQAAPVLAVLPDATELVVVYGPSEHEGYDWWYVDGPYGTGWAAGAFLALA